MLTLIERKKLPVTTLFRAIGYQSDKDILEIFDLADEVKATQGIIKEIYWKKISRKSS